ncbi:tyrosine-type recombinase/integrase [Methylobacter sp.]|uniref:tyrosine-type recombinase/integrase n=1 Tax=Methylobacter sp. TaxID=2051955 RepID=UPI003DA4B120
MPPKSHETLVNAGDASAQHAPNHVASPVRKKGISDAALRAAKPSDKPYKIATGGGLYLEVTPRGSKLWRWKYRIQGKENRYALGSYPELTLKDAREKVEAARKLVEQGLHPAQQKRLERTKSAHEHINTFEAIAKEWLALKDWEEITKKRRLGMLQRVIFPAIGHLPVRQITPPVILAILQKAADNNGISVMAEAKRTLFGIFELAAETFRVDSNPVHQWRAALPKNKTQHKRALDITEIGQLMRDVDNHGSNYQTRCAFNLMWLTLARPSEVIEAEWSEFDLDRAIWRIPAERMKKRKEHVIPLPSQAVKLLRGMDTITGDKKHVFPHRDNRAKPMVAASFRQMLNTLGWSGKFSPHATRTTGSTRLNELGFSADWIERQLAHSEANSVRRTYNHADYLKDRTNMMQQWADLLDQWKTGDIKITSPNM